MIARQSFYTQFVLDISSAVNVTVDRIYVHSVDLGNVHYEWLSRYVIVSFRMYGANVTINSNRYMGRENGECVKC